MSLIAIQRAMVNEVAVTRMEAAVERAGLSQDDMDVFRGLLDCWRGAVFSDAIPNKESMEDIEAAIDDARSASSHCDEIAYHLQRALDSLNGKAK